MRDRAIRARLSVTASIAVVAWLLLWMIVPWL